ncbi:hypothetical protein BKA67DRAFT_691712 [Truncatella angustata]|uniref:Major facilitator superfamily (MFS) profile domain-containing protein n=1 Tax=Truncatella angustata TaxID=152316 RepID=A0A9P8ZY40_9PEZI|nr:uncharacterized protein BKA67DRAFT_691712 [Truncatella angustata]KAH6654738.1 hypothetical protein BKA67DRAFT_691712 [Truncatella angustata]
MGREQTPDNEKQEESKVEQYPHDISGWRWALAMISILCSIFLYALDATVVADIQAITVQKFDSLQDLSWVGIFNVALFEVGSAICGTAPNIEAMIVGRVICGIGGSGLYIGVMTSIAVTTTLAERPLYISGTGLTWGWYSSGSNNRRRFPGI